jgi:hypothetical protein
LQTKQDGVVVIIGYRYDGVAGGDGEDVGAGDGLVAHGLHLALDAVDDGEASQRILVRDRPLLAGEGGRVVQQNRRVAALHIYAWSP